MLAGPKGAGCWHAWSWSHQERVRDDERRGNREGRGAGKRGEGLGMDQKMVLQLAV